MKRTPRSGRLSPATKPGPPLRASQVNRRSGSPAKPPTRGTGSRLAASTVKRMPRSGRLSPATKPGPPLRASQVNRRSGSPAKPPMRGAGSRLADSTMKRTPRSGRLSPATKPGPPPRASQLNAMHLLRIDETVVVGGRGQGILIPPCDSASTFRDPGKCICSGLFFTGAGLLWPRCYSACNFDPPYCLIENVTEDPAPMIGAAPPNRVGGAHGGNYQHGRAARGFVGGGGALSVGGADGEGAHPRRAMPDDGLASQARGAGIAAARRREGS